MMNIPNNTYNEFIENGEMYYINLLGKVGDAITRVQDKNLPRQMMYKNKSSLSISWLCNNAHEPIN